MATIVAHGIYFGANRTTKSAQNEARKTTKNLLKKVDAALAVAAGKLSLEGGASPVTLGPWLGIRANRDQQDQ